MVKKKPHISQRQTKNPSKLMTILSLAMVFLLPYYLVTHFSHHKKNNLTQKKLPLPKLVQTEIEPRQPKIAPISLQKPALNRLAEKEPPKPLVKQVEAPQLKPKAEQPKIPIKAPVPVKQEVNLNPVWHTIYPKPGDSMASIFRRMGLSPQVLHAVLQRNPYSKVLTSIKPSQKLEFLIHKKSLEKLLIPMNEIQTLMIYKHGRVYKTQINAQKTQTRTQYFTGTVKGSLYTTAQKMGIPSKLISQMTQIFNKNIDFAHSIRSGDDFSIAYEAIYIADKRVGTGDIQAVSFTNQHKTYKAIRYVTRGHLDYYSPEGESLKKAFSRYPIKFSHISSTFSVSRYHPILHYKRAHKGIDLAAPIGTPIQATGDGTIVFIGRHHGYGNMVELKHDSKYTTIYGHMLKFQKGLYKGSKVKRNQVIGYVGQTGLASGPHCHYELHVNNQPRNPTTVGLPTAPSIPSREMASFRTKTKSLFNQLELASKGKKNIG